MNSSSPKDLPLPASGTPVRPPTTSSANRTIHDFIDSMSRQRFYGTITVRFEDGVPVHVHREESLPVGKLSTGYEGVRDE